MKHSIAILILTMVRYCFVCLWCNCVLVVWPDTQEQGFSIKIMLMMFCLRDTV